MSILTRAKLQIGQRRAGTCHFGGERFAVEIKIDTVDPSNPFIKLIHQTRDDRKRDRSVRDRIRLVWTVPTYGGQRWWFLCPRTGRRTTKLYVPDGGRHFWSRDAYGLGYACQREDRFSRLQRRAGNAEPTARRRGVGKLGQPSGQAKMDALADV
jgi:hypothetical protein